MADNLDVVLNTAINALRGAGVDKAAQAIHLLLDQGKRAQEQAESFA